MTIFDLYSKRRRRETADPVDAYSYEIPEALRIQLISIFEENIDEGTVDLEKFVLALRREFARHELHDGMEYGNKFSHMRRTRQELCVFLAYEEDDELIVDAVELFCSGKLRGKAHSPMSPALRNAVTEINQRFAESAVGFEFVNGQIIRKDSEFAHREMVIPALRLLSASAFAGANSEYRAAHQHFRRGEYGDCLSECLKCFESTMKVVCEQRGWDYDKNRTTASGLVNIINENGLFLRNTQGLFTSLPQMLISGIPTPRNREDGHGSGATPHVVAKEMAALLLHQTAAVVLFLADSAGMR